MYKRQDQLSTTDDGRAAVRCLINPDPVRYPTLYAEANILNPNFNLLQTSTIYVFIQVRPKGCLQYINIYLGLTTDTNA